MNEEIFRVVMFSLALPIAGLAAFIIWRKSSAAKSAVIRQEGGGLRIPLKAAFSGWKGVAWFSWSHNSIWPLLVLHPDHVECRVIQRRRKEYAAVERVDYRETFGTRNVVLEFTDSIASFIGNTANRDVARQAILHLREKGCRLSEKAEALVGHAGVAAESRVVS
ncbi:hypothetical protein [Inquilinus sp. CAU 1745]|uniref:hypothetical protein n=1 Tax=Inquilinus sp. CAU 1745 TaxID=3140369 RepID=UPI00325AF489